MRAITIAFALLAFTGVALAQNNRSFVSTTGNDANTCVPGSECRSFTRAMAMTNPGGEIIALTSGGYGPFTVTKSISVIGALGINASISVSSGDGIAITAGTSDHVVLRGLTITSTATLAAAINAISYNTLSVDQCTINGGDYGFVIGGPMTSYVTATDTVVRNLNQNGFVISARAALIRCRAESTDWGLLVQDAAGNKFGSVSAVEFVAVNNQIGVYVASSSADNHPEVNLDRALISHNQIDGFLVGGGPGAVYARVSNSTVVDNGRYGFNISTNGIIASPGNNFVAANFTGDVNGTLTRIAAQ